MPMSDARPARSAHAPEGAAGSDTRADHAGGLDRPRRYELIVFDWDGTLADSAALIAHAIRQACADLGLPVPSEADARYVIGLGLDDALRHVAPTLPPADYPRLSARYRAHYVTQDAIPLFSGVGEMLETLLARGHRLGIATGKSRRGLDIALAQAGIGHRFVATRCADEGFPKPHPEMIERLLEATGVAPGAALMIGDTTHDLLLARNAGIDAVGVAYGAHPHEALATLSHRAIVSDVGELARWLAANG
jgi:phosphoglycolate phosphatase